MDAHDILVDVCASMAIASDDLAKLRALKDGAALLSIPVFHGFMDRNETTDRLIEQSINVGIADSLGLYVIETAISDALNNYELPQINGHEHYINGAFDATPWSIIDPKLIPRRQWLYAKHYIRKFVSATISPGGIGKTSLVIAEAIAMVTRTPILDIPVEAASRVWVWNGEDPIEELRRRVIAICQRYGIEQSELDGLFMDSGRTHEICIANELKGGATINAPDYEKVMLSIKRNNIDVIVIDPFVSSHRVNENDNNSIDLVAKAWARIADEADCSIELVHHARKTGKDEVTVEHARGAVALIAAARSARVLNGMTDDEAKKVGRRSLNGVRKQFFRVDNGKANLALPPNRSRWYKMETVTLPNSVGGILDNGDEVGVPTPWEWPDVFEDVTEEQLAEAKRIIGTEPKWRESSRSSDWVGYALGNLLGVSSGEKDGRAKIIGVLKMWISSGELKVIEDEDDERHTRHWVVSAD